MQIPNYESNYSEYINSKIQNILLDADFARNQWICCWRFQPSGIR